MTGFPLPDPDPAPFTTIGWRLAHLADCKVMYHEWAFGARKLTFPDLVAPSSVAGAVARCEGGAPNEPITLIAWGKAHHRYWLIAAKPQGPGEGWLCWASRSHTHGRRRCTPRRWRAPRCGPA